MKKHSLPCDGAGGLDPPPSTQRTPPGPPWDPPDPSRSPSAAFSSKSRRPRAASPPMGQRRRHTASGRDGFCFCPSPPWFLLFFLAERTCMRVERMFVASSVAFVAPTTMESPMRTEPNAPLGATKPPSTMAHPVDRALTPRESNTQKTSSGSVDVLVSKVVKA